MSGQGTGGLPTGLVTDPAYWAHKPSAWHPECPARLTAVLDGITKAVPGEALLRLAPRPATLEEIYRCHPPQYVELVREEVEAGFGTLSTGDTDIGRRSYEVALLAAGGRPALCLADKPELERLFIEFAEGRA